MTAAALFVGSSARASDATSAAALVRDAEATIVAFAQDNDIGEFRQALSGAKGVLIFPHVVKAAEVIGGSSGRGVLLVRDQQTGDWIGPAFYALSGVSVGLQLGASTTRTVILLQSKEALDSVYGGKFKLGGDASMSLWENGMSAGALAGKDFAAFSTVKGVYVGISVAGSAIGTRAALNGAYYGVPVSAADILVERKVRNPAAAGLRNALKRITKLDL